MTKKTNGERIVKIESNIEYGGIELKRLVDGLEKHEETSNIFRQKTVLNESAIVGLGKSISTINKLLMSIFVTGILGFVVWISAVIMLKKMGG